MEGAAAALGAAAVTAAGAPPSITSPPSARRAPAAVLKTYLAFSSLILAFTFVFQNSLKNM